LYVCATASLPIAAAFILTGMSPGAAFVFLSAGPATNTVTMGVVLEMFGKRSLFIYLGTISLLSILFGYCWDSFLGDVNVLQISGHFETFGILESIGTAVMLSLSGYYFIKGNKK
ncbi:MAG TPA: permease, partial [Sulfurovum sp.]|nr:permease [Sulfurovum sp.]